MSAEPRTDEPPTDERQTDERQTGEAETWTLVCRVDDVAPGTAAQAEVDGTVVALVREVDGTFHAVDDSCTHGKVSLSEGEVDGCYLECWLHGSRFDLRTGRPSGPPAITPVAVYPVKIDGDQVLVSVHRQMEN